MVAPSITQVVVLVNPHASSKNMNASGSIMYIINLYYKRSMSSIGANHLGIFSKILKTVF